MEIVKIANDDVRMSEVLKLVWQTFLEYEAPDYTDEGVEEFRRSINDPSFLKKLSFTIAIEDNKVVGTIATRNMTHIAMFFVDGSYHRRGIGRSLFNSVVEENTENYFTVNSSPYAKEIYEHLGFDTTDEIQEVNGLKFYPMKNNNVHELKFKNGKK